jgi:acyl-CoA oxidase
VQCNLFAGSVIALGAPAHATRLAAMHAAGELGCFALTERDAGVLSGLKIDTLATWDPVRGGFGACVVVFVYSLGYMAY